MAVALIRPADCDHPAQKWLFGLGKVRFAVQCEKSWQHLLKRLRARRDLVAFSTRARPRAASTDSFGFRHFKPFEFSNPLNLRSFLSSLLDCNLSDIRHRCAVGFCSLS